MFTNIGEAQARANVALLCAAPDLLTACRAVLTREPVTGTEGRVTGTSGVMLPEAIRQQVEAAVARAEGKGAAK